MGHCSNQCKEDKVDEESALKKTKMGDNGETKEEAHINITLGDLDLGNQGTMEDYDLMEEFIFITYVLMSLANQVMGKKGGMKIGSLDHPP